MKRTNSVPHNRYVFRPITLYFWVCALLIATAFVCDCLYKYCQSTACEQLHRVIDGIYEFLPKKNSLVEGVIVFEVLFTLITGFFVIGSMYKEKYLGLSFSEYRELLKKSHFSILEMVVWSTLFLFAFLVSYFLKLRLSMVAVLIVGLATIVAYSLSSIPLLRGSGETIRKWSTKYFLDNSPSFEGYKDKVDMFFRMVIKNDYVTKVIFHQLFTYGFLKTLETVNEKKGLGSENSLRFLTYAQTVFIYDIDRSHSSFKGLASSFEYEGFRGCDLFERCFSNIDECVCEYLPLLLDDTMFEPSRARDLIMLHSAIDSLSQSMSLGDAQNTHFVKLLRKIVRDDKFKLFSPSYSFLIGVSSLTPSSNPGDITWWCRALRDSEIGDHMYFQTYNPVGFILSARMWAIHCNEQYRTKKQDELIVLFINDKSKGLNETDRSWADLLRTLLSRVEENGEYFTFLKRTMSFIEKLKIEDCIECMTTIDGSGRFDPKETVLKETIVFWAYLFIRFVEKGTDPFTASDYKLKDDWQKAGFSESEKSVICQIIADHVKTQDENPFMHFFPVSSVSKAKLGDSNEYDYSVKELIDIIKNGFK